MPWENLKWAEKKLKEAFTICDRVGCKPDVLVEAYQAMGIALVNDNRLSKAEDYLDRSLRLSEELGLADYTSTTLHWFARLRYSEDKSF